MNVDDGKWNEDTFWKYTTLLESPEWKADAEIIGKNCVDSKSINSILYFRNLYYFTYT